LFIFVLKPSLISTGAINMAAFMEHSEIIIYQSEDGNSKVEVRLEGETVTQLFGISEQFKQRDLSLIMITVLIFAGYAQLPNPFTDPHG